MSDVSMHHFIREVENITAGTLSIDLSNLMSKIWKVML